MIKSFKNQATEDIFNGTRSKKSLKLLPNELHEQAAFKLDLINITGNLNDLRVPPSNRLEKLTGNRKGFHSLRINDQWRIIFRWSADGAEDVEILDYH
mgnify:CR=1 FL=1